MCGGRRQACPPVFERRAMKRLIPMLMALLLLFLNIPVPVYAAETSTNVWVRAQVSYESEGSLTGLSDEMITFSSSDWTKKDGWFYYGKPVQSGQSIDLMKSVKIPTSWNNNDSGKTFNIVVKVEAAEAFPGDSGWAEGSPAVYSQSFDMSKQNAEKYGLTVQQGNIRIRLEEFQETGGKEQPYENSKIVVPGETVSKIVRITVEGEKSKLSPIEQILRGPVKTGDDGVKLPLLVLAGMIIALLVYISRGGKGGGHGSRTLAAA